MKHIGTVQRAVSDLAMIRKAIERARADDKGEKGEKVRRSALEANLLIQSISLLFVLVLCVVELVSEHAMTRSMLLFSPIWEEGVLGVVLVGAILAMFVVALYFIVWRSARHSEQEFSRFIAINFKYLRGLSLLADLVIKFIAFSLVMLAPRPEWIAPLLIVFTADYLFQGRYFNLPIRASLALGVLCIGAAVALYLTGTALLLWPLLLFAVVNALSLLVLIRAWRTETSDKEAEAS
jgi:hypothetical protein